MEHTSFSYRGKKMTTSNNFVNEKIEKNRKIGEDSAIKHPRPEPTPAPPEKTKGFMGFKEKLTQADIDEHLEATKYMCEPELLKQTSGKPRLTLVPRKIITAIARVREYGNMKYRTSDSWKLNTAEQYRDAAYRHWLEYLDDPESLDAESGLPHLWHLATNIAFLIEGGFKGE